RGPRCPPHVQSRRDSPPPAGRRDLQRVQHGRVRRDSDQHHERELRPCEQSGQHSTSGSADDQGRVLMDGGSRMPTPSRRRSRTAIALLALVALAAPRAVAQIRIAGAIAGTVTDSAGLVVPGASVRLVDEGTGIAKSAVTNEAGGFLFPDLSFGAYSVTVTLQGFQTAAYQDVQVESGRTTDLRIRLQPGALTEEVQVRGVTPVLEMSSNIISATVTKNEMDALPLNGRSTLAYARLIPGSVAPTGTGSTHYNGMPGGTINPTIDGINNAPNGFKSGGTSFFATVAPPLGAMQEVPVETARLRAPAA